MSGDAYTEGRTLQILLVERFLLVPRPPLA